MDELMKKKATEILGDIPKRLLLAISKMLGVKGAIWATATAMLWFDKIDPWAWVAISIIVIFGREALKFFKDIR